MRRLIWALIAAIPAAWLLYLVNIGSLSTLRALGVVAALVAINVIGWLEAKTEDPL